jgi:hypothetical protein
MTAKMIQGTDLMLLRRYDHRSPEVQAQLLNQVRAWQHLHHRASESLKSETTAAKLTGPV